MLLSKCLVCNSQKLNFTKGQEASGLLSSLGIKAPLSKIPLLGNILLKAIKWMKKWTFFYKQEINSCPKSI